MFKRLFPVFLVSVLLAGLAAAKPAVATRNSHSSGMSALESRPSPGCSRAPSTLQFDFGTVVRDTADEQSFGPGHWQAPRYMPMWHSYFTWFTALLGPR